MGGNSQNNQNDWMQSMMAGSMGYPGMNTGMNTGMNMNMGTMGMPNNPMQNTQGGMNGQNIDPQLFTQMMMNQMMTNFNFDSGDKDR